MKTLILLFTSTICSAQFFAPSLTTIYQDNEFHPGQRYGLDIKYFAIHGDKEYFFDLALAFGDNKYSDNDLARFGFGCKTGDRLKYGAMLNTIGYRMVNYPESTKDLYTASVAVTPLLSYDINQYFYTEIGMSVTAFQMGDFQVGNSYFLSFGMRWR